MHSEEWERAILQKNNDPLHVPKKGLFKNNKTQAQVFITQKLFTKLSQNLIDLITYMYITYIAE